MKFIRERRDSVMEKWIDFNKKLPPVNKKILARLKDGKMKIGYLIPTLLGYAIRDEYETWDLGYLSHWMPIPDDPIRICSGCKRKLKKNEKVYRIKDLVTPIEDYILCGDCCEETTI